MTGPSTITARDRNSARAGDCELGVAATGYAIALLVAVTRAYRRADPLERRQLKWMAYGFYVAILSFAVYIAVSSLGILTEWIGALFVVQAIAQVAIPLGFVVAVAFYQFLDIDRLFSATLSERSAPATSTPRRIWPSSVPLPPRSRSARSRSMPSP